MKIYKFFTNAKSFIKKSVKELKVFFKDLKDFFKEVKESIRQFLSDKDVKNLFNELNESIKQFFSIQDLRTSGKYYDELKKQNLVDVIFQGKLKIVKKIKRLYNKYTGNKYSLKQYMEFCVRYYIQEREEYNKLDDGTKSKFWELLK